MNEPRRFEDLPAERILAALEIAPDKIVREEAAELRQFVTRIGGPENARAAARLLRDLERAI